MTSQNLTFDQFAELIRVELLCELNGYSSLDTFRADFMQYECLDPEIGARKFGFLSLRHLLESEQMRQFVSVFELKEAGNKMPQIIYKGKEPPKHILEMQRIGQEEMEKKKRKQMYWEQMNGKKSAKRFAPVEAIRMNDEVGHKKIRLIEQNCGQQAKLGHVQQDKRDCPKCAKNEEEKAEMQNELEKLRKELKHLKDGVHKFLVEYASPELAKQAEKENCAEKERKNQQQDNIELYMICQLQPAYLIACRLSDSEDLPFFLKVDYGQVTDENGNTVQNVWPGQKLAVRGIKWLQRFAISNDKKPRDGSKYWLNKVTGILPVQAITTEPAQLIKNKQDWRYLDGFVSQVRMRNESLANIVVHGLPAPINSVRFIQRQIDRPEGICVGDRVRVAVETVENGARCHALYILPPKSPFFEGNETLTVIVPAAVIRV